MNLTEEIISKDRERFLAITKSITRSGANIDKLICKLEASDFFYAPASTQYHCSCKGGLVHHCLNVYDNLLNLVTMKGLNDAISMDTIAIVGLFHDISKMNLYQITYRNKKVYMENGSKRDENGRFDWVSEPSYVTAPKEERFIYGNHEETSEFMLRQYIPLTYEESASILCHHGGLGYDSTQSTAPMVMARYKLATLLHIADLMSAYVDEGDN